MKGKIKACMSKYNDY